MLKCVGGDRVRNAKVGLPPKMHPDGVYIITANHSFIRFACNFAYLYIHDILCCKKIGKEIGPKLRDFSYECEK